jgi:hemolysin activation/secretion protein
MAKRTYPSSTFFVFALGLVAPYSMAQNSPDAGELQQQIEREHQQQMPRHMAPDKPAAPAVINPANGVVIIVKQFRFAGNSFIRSLKTA